MTNYFDGKSFATAKERKLIKKVDLLKQNGIVPRLISLQIGKNDSSKKYLSLKKKAAGRIGIEMEVISLSEDVGVDQIAKVVSAANEDKSVHGIMLQLPLPPSYSTEDRDRIINTISSQKDIDGMRDDGEFVVPVVKAVMTVLEFAEVEKDAKTIVVGAKGFVGGKIVDQLTKEGYSSEGYDVETKDLDQKTKEAKVIISATGQEGIIRSDMVKEGVVLIDVGAPKGDLDKSSYDKASFVSPVPGGVGPMTIHFLLTNVIKSALKT